MKFAIKVIIEMCTVYTSESKTYQSSACVTVLIKSCVHKRNIYIHPLDVCTLLDKNKGRSERKKDEM